MNSEKLRSKELVEALMKEVAADARELHGKIANIKEIEIVSIWDFDFDLIGTLGALKVLFDSLCTYAGYIEGQGGGKWKDELYKKKLCGDWD